MSEGELKKRIREHRPVILCDNVALAELGKILDEAKKELPLPSEAKEGCVQYSMDIVEWYKKWFGEVEAKP